MRRSIESSADTRGGEDAGEHVADGAFAVGAGDVDGAKGAGGAAQSLVKGQHMRQPGLIGAVETRLLDGRKTQENLTYKRLICLFVELHRTNHFELITNLRIFGENLNLICER